MAKSGKKDNNNTVSNIIIIIKTHSMNTLHRENHTEIFLKFLKSTSNSFQMKWKHSSSNNKL